MAQDIIPVDADKLLFIHDLVNHIFRKRLEVHVHHMTSDFRESIYEAFDPTMVDAVDFLEDLLELEIDAVFYRLKRENAINEAAYVRYAEKLIKMSLPLGFDARISLKVSVHLALMAEKFYSDGTVDAPYLAVRFSHLCFKDADMMNGGWSSLDLIARNMQITALALSTPSEELDVEQHIPNPEPQIAKQHLGPANFSRKDDLGREGINELRVQAVRVNNSDFVISYSPSKAVPLENVNKSSSRFARMFSNLKTPYKESSEEADLRIFYGSSGNEQFVNQSSENEVSGGNVSEPASTVLPLGSRGRKRRSAKRSSSKVLPENKANEPDSKLFPEKIGENRMFANPDSGKEVILLGKANESDLKVPRVPAVNTQ